MPAVVADSRAVVHQLEEPDLNSIDSSKETSRSQLQRELSKAPTSKKSVDLVHRAQEIYKSIEDGLFGFGTDEERLFKALEGLSADQIDRLRVIYREHYGEDLDDHIAGDLSGTTLTQAKSLLKGDTVAATADKLREAMEGVGTDEDTIIKALQGFSGDPRELSRVFKERYDISLEEALTSELSGDDLKEALSLLNKDVVGAAAAKIHDAISGLGTDEDQVREAFSSLSEAQIQELRERYEKEYGESLEEALRDDYSDDELREVEALSKGRKADAVAIRLQDAIANGSRESIEQEFVGKSESERAEILAAYDRSVGGTGEDLDRFSRDLKASDEFNLEELDKINSTVTSGTLTLAQRFHDAIDGLGTGSEIGDLLKEIGDLSPNEVAQVKQEYEDRFGESLEDALDGDLSGRLAADSKLYLNGLPEDPIEREIALAKRHLSMVEREREGFSVGNLLLDPFTDKDERVDDSAEDLRALLKEIESTPNPNAKQIEKLRELNKWVGSDLEDVRSAKDAVAEGAATVGATVAAAAAIAATGGAATPLAIAAVAAASGAGYAGAKAIVLGADYELDGAVVDIAAGAVDGAMNIVGAAAAAKIVAKLGGSGIGKALSWGADAVVDAGLGGAAGGIVQTSLQKETWQDGLVDGIGKVAESAVVQGAIGALTGAAIKGSIAAVVAPAGIVFRKTVADSPDLPLQPKSPEGGWFGDEPPKWHHGNSPDDTPTVAPESMTTPLPPVRKGIDALLDLPPGGRGVTLGRAGDIELWGADRRVSREQLSIVKFSDGTYKVTDGVPSSTNGVYVNGSKIAQRADNVVKIGDEIRVGQSVFRIPQAGNDLTAEEIGILSKLHSGQPVSIGRGPGNDIVLNDPEVSLKHAKLEKLPDGRIVIRDGSPSSHGSEFFDGKRWRALTSEQLAPGTPIRVAGVYEFRLPRPDRPVRGEQFGIQWSLVADQKDLVVKDYTERALRGESIPVGGGVSILAFDASAGERVILGEALGHVSPEIRARIKEVHIVDEIGEIHLPGGVDKPIRAFPVDENGRLVIARD
ncbi:MAG: FHA domain-containing protein, partial [Bdellovibrionales bacterium]|nr:FHA domain-containing protein [Bdellovibrionales bacterium]